MAWWPFKKKNKEADTAETPAEEGFGAEQSGEAQPSGYQEAAPYGMPQTPGENTESAAVVQQPEEAYTEPAPAVAEVPTAPVYTEAAAEPAPAAAAPVPEIPAAQTEAPVVKPEPPAQVKVAPLFAKKNEESAEAAPELPAEEPAPAEEEAPVEEKKKKKGFFKRLKEGLAKTRDNFVYNLDIIFDGAAAIDDEFYEELEEILVMGDIGVRTTEEILDNLKEQVEKQRIVRPAECKQLLIDNIREQMHVGDAAYLFETRPSVVFVIGVNGVGKTTSIGKIASHLKAMGRHVMMAAADTFRAAAGDQLKIWAERAGVELIGGKEGADPSSVLYDAAGAARARGVDVLLVDTAGRLNNKKNLMEELKKMNRVIDKEFPDAYRENLIVLDATTGQNALQQAKDFNDVADLSGIILTKMDGTAKGGIAVAIQSELKIPVKYIGVGEHIEDLQKFDADAFVEALFDVETEKDEDGDEENADADT